MGHGNRSCNVFPTVFKSENKNLPLYLVDFPGFKDTGGFVKRMGCSIALWDILSSAKSIRIIVVLSVDEIIKLTYNRGKLRSTIL